MLCIPKDLRPALTKALKDGSLDVQKLMDIKDSEARRAEFEKVLGSDYAKTANTLFEQGMAKADIEQGVINALKKMTGLSEKVKQDYIAKIANSDRLLSPGDGEAILQDAREQALGVALTDEQAKTLSDLAKKMDALNPENRGDVKKLQGLIDAVKDLPDLTDEQKTTIDEIQKTIDEKPGNIADKQLTKDALGKLQGIIKKAFGKDIPPEVQDKIDELKSLHETEEETKDEQILGTTADFKNAKKDFGDYIRSLDEIGAGKSVWNSVRSLYKNLFIGVKTGIKTGIFGSANSILEAVTRRISSMKAIDDVDASKKLDGVKAIISMYAKTGDNSALNINGDDAIFGKNKFGHAESFGVGKETVTGSKTAVAIAKAFNMGASGVKYFTIDVLHKLPMLINSAVNFVDSVGLTSSTLAKMDFTKEAGMDANAIFDDAMKENPETDLGKIARMRAQQDTFRVLNINNTWLSNATTELQRSLNKTAPGLGDLLLPMAKVPSTVVANQIENAGGGLFTGSWKIKQGITELNGLKEAGTDNSIEGTQARLKIRDGANTLVRTIGVIAAAALIASKLNKKGFNTDPYGNSYVKSGHYWLNTEVFGPLGTAISGMMMGRTGHTGFIPNASRSIFEELKHAPITEPFGSIMQKGATAEGVKGIITDKLKSFYNPILIQDIQKSIAEKSKNPLIFGSLIKTDKQLKQEKAASSAKKAATAKNKGKSQTLLGL